MAKKEYSNGEIIVGWEAEKCIHAGKCVKNSPEVFKPKDRPWINPENDSTENIKHAIDQCPSGALTYKEA